MNTAFEFDRLQTQFVGAAPGRFAFRRSGPRGQTPLVMCNRFRGTIDHWDPALLDPLAAERDVIVFDNAGVGLSDGVVPSDVWAMSDDALAFVELLGLDEIDLLGWSMGGFVAQAMTLTRPSLIRRLIVAASKPGPVSGAPRPPEKVSQIAPKPVNDDEDFLYLFFAESDASRSAGLASLRRLDTRLRESGSTVSGEGTRAQGEALAAWSSGTASASERLEELTLPVLVADGAHDVLMDPYHSYAMVKRLPDATLILYGDAGHAFLFQHAEAFSHQVLDFLR
jgi:pimeloyl-ACP methyl ester carboxylesterase